MVCNFKIEVFELRTKCKDGSLHILPLLLLQSWGQPWAYLSCLRTAIWNTTMKDTISAPHALLPKKDAVFGGKRSWKS